MVCWPCLLTLEGDDELIYLADESEFINECQELIVSDDDAVVDSNGMTYLIKAVESDLQLVKTERVFSTQEVTQLIRDHEFSKANVCLTKIEFINIPSAIQSLVYSA
ncbi:DUF4144 domain-containing protein [Psychromonas sp. SR45-3]|uniref:DUF4144 domain-containing protein n=1 Tax=Psychromonas sp. SR45-3 TaxID=2760930 RepID=UPI0015FE577F|nr:DUF4144 domain-containing protein [Psychromonas sp. SR45-3]MBB1273712.1 DUF4144 domain-containing protein [Psychromonas sp. SR45-3]